MELEIKGKGREEECNKGRNEGRRGHRVDKGGRKKTEGKIKNREERVKRNAKDFLCERLCLFEFLGVYFLSCF